MDSLPLAHYNTPEKATTSHPSPEKLKETNHQLNYFQKEKMERSSSNANLYQYVLVPLKRSPK